MKYVKLFQRISYEALKVAGSGKYIYLPTEVAFFMRMVPCFTGDHDCPRCLF